MANRTDTNLVASLSKAEAFKLANEQKKQTDYQNNLLRTLVSSNASIDDYVGELATAPDNVKDFAMLRKTLESMKKTQDRLLTINQSLKDTIVNKEKTKEKIDLTRPADTQKAVEAQVSLEKMFSTYIHSKDPHGVASEMKRTIGKVTSVILSKTAKKEASIANKAPDLLRTDDNDMLNALGGIQDGIEGLGDKVGDSGIGSGGMGNLLKILGAAAISFTIATKGIGLSGILKHADKLFKIFAPEGLTKIVGFIGDKVGPMLRQVGDDMLRPITSFAKNLPARIGGVFKNLFPKFSDDVMKLFAKVGGKLGGKAMGKGLLKFGAKALKALPGLGTIVAIPFAINRFKKGDVVGGLIELASGVASLDVTGTAGTAISIALEAYQVFRDVKGDAYKEQEAAVLKKVALRNLPVIGPITRIKSAMEMWKTDKFGAIREFGGAMAAMVPGMGMAFDIGASIGDKIKDFAISKIGEERIAKLQGNKAVRNLPVIGSVIWIKEGFDAWNGGDTIGGLKKIGRGVATMVPGGGFIFDIVSSIAEWAVNTPFGQGVIKAVGNHIGRVKAMLQPIFDGVKWIWDGLTGYFSNLWDDIKTVGSFVGDAASGVWNKGKEIFGTAFAGASELFDNMTNEDGTLNLSGLTDAMSGLMTKAEDFFNRGKEKAQEIWNKSKETVVNIWNKGKNFIRGLFGPGDDLTEEEAQNQMTLESLNALKERVFTKAQELWDRGREMAREVWDKTKETITGLWNRGRQFFSDIIGGDNDVVDVPQVQGMQSTVTPTAGGIFSSASDIITEATQAAGNVGDDAVAVASGTNGTGTGGGAPWWGIAREDYEPGIRDTAGAPLVTSLAVKPGANMTNINLGPRHGNMDNIILGAYQSVMGQGFQPTITSGRRNPSTNSRAGSTPRSKHLVGQALDLRSNDSVMTAAQGQRVATNLKSALGPQYGVLQHGSGMNRHIHMQYNGGATESGDMPSGDVPRAFEATQGPQQLENATFTPDTSDVEKMKKFTSFLMNEFSTAMANKIAGAMGGQRQQQQAQAAPQPNPF